MIVEINYTVLMWDNHQGASGRPTTGRAFYHYGEGDSLGFIKETAVADLKMRRNLRPYEAGSFTIKSIVVHLDISIPD